MNNSGLLKTVIWRHEMFLSMCRLVYFLRINCLAQMHLTINASSSDRETENFHSRIKLNGYVNLSDANIIVRDSVFIGRNGACFYRVLMRSWLFYRKTI